MITHVQQQFGPSADAYATSDVHARGESLKVLLQLLQPESTWHILDIATGAGHTALTTAPHASHVYALDLTPAMLVKTQELAVSRDITNLTAALASGDRLPWPNESIDAITCRLALHHFTDASQAVEEWFRVLRPGGKVGLTDNVVINNIEIANEYNQFEAKRDPSHHWVWPGTHLESIFTERGFRILTSLELTKEFEFHQWADRQRVTPEDKAILLNELQQASPGLEAWLTPRWGADTFHFNLREIVILAQKPSAAHPSHPVHENKKAQLSPGGSS
jgi:ubiquinone/menaquinone biosynthesis C-methylase UbiE